MNTGIIKNKDFLIKVFFVFIFLILTFLLINILNSNEAQILPNAKKMYYPNWLKNDWFLNLNTHYRLFFNLVVGSLTTILPLYIVSIVCRGIAYLLFSIIIVRFMTFIQIGTEFSIIVIFFFSRYQSLIAGEWIIGQIEAKVFAYIFVLFGIYSLIHKQWFKVAVFTGLAVSSHVLIGVYASFSMLLFMLLNMKEYRYEFKTILKVLPIFILFSGFGIYSIILNLVNNWGIDTSTASVIYIIRSAHHLLPSYWISNKLGIFKVLASIIFLLSTVVIDKNTKRRTLAKLGLSSYSLFLIGLIFYLTGKHNLLKYYWFRFPDTIVPLLCFLISFSFISEVVSRQAEREIANIKIKNTVKISCFIISFILLLKPLYNSGKILKKSIISRNPVYIEYYSNNYITLTDWIKHNTSENDIFLVSPTIDTFYIAANRAEYVSFKHVPQDETHVEEWYRRIKVCNNNEPLRSYGFRNLSQIEENFYSLDDKKVNEICRENGIKYYVGLVGKRRELNSVYKNDEYSIYTIDSHKNGQQYK